MKSWAIGTNWLDIISIDWTIYFQLWSLVIKCSTRNNEILSIWEWMTILFDFFYSFVRVIFFSFEFSSFTLFFWAFFDFFFYLQSEIDNMFESQSNVSKLKKIETKVICMFADRYERINTSTKDSWIQHLIDNTFLFIQWVIAIHWCFSFFFWY